MIDVRKLASRLTRKPSVSVERRVSEPSQLCRDRARAWVHAYAVGGAAFALVPIPVPGSTTAGLVALETTMVHAIGRIYGSPLDVKDAAAIVTGLEVGGSALRVLSRQLVQYVPGIGWVVRSALAVATIEAIGNTVIEMYERRHPNRVAA